MPLVRQELIRQLAFAHLAACTSRLFLASEVLWHWIPAWFWVPLVILSITDLIMWMVMRFDPAKYISLIEKRVEKK